MSFLTEQTLANSIDIPICLPATDLDMSNWLVVATTTITAPMSLTYQFASLNVISAAVSPALLLASNYIYGSLGLAYLTLRQNYSGGDPGAAGALDALANGNLGLVSRNTASPVTILTPGTYSWIVANNLQPTSDSTSTIPVSTSLDLKVSVLGTVRLTLSSA